MKKKIIVLIVAALLVGGGCFVAYKKGLFRGGSKSVDNSAEVYVMTLDEIMGANSSYSSDVFMGVVEGQETSSVTKSTERELDTIFVSEGDTVEKGTPLFSYKIDNLEAENVQYGFDIEGYNLSIQECNDDIAKKQKELDKITGDTDEDKDKKEALANEIAGLNTDIKIAQNSIDQTNAKIEENNRKINNSVVKSSVSGVVTKIADDTNPYTTDGSFITILGASEMRIKGQINEQNVWAINVDEPVTLRSRVDASQTWTGTITKIDTESKQENTDSMYSYGGSSENSSTKYPFYVTLDDSEGLMMGQHVYIELGKTDAPEMDFSDGTYIYDYYISYEEDGTPFLWVEDGNRLAKQTIELGDYYEEQMVYAVSGIDKDTKIAYPMDDYKEGMKTVSGQEVQP
ncbi:HlyD family secretion protein [Pseudobutyrivibrio sp. NOR37]|uniref:Efflux RND transporter periplasmic adaptor subunit n=1 Tax=Pseudobutyrivibrio xylanivorans TaxID=185007 RepID=A0A6M0LE54_PSEXY|nr:MULTISPECIES: efflux RND transporter periplasmic adaptor subunit [Pseudobutyrivibrio]NEX00875.1 efflux RND transporter periplasmic adaptor subunit [Pseudobutyrivibrio xylanivorans]SFR63409.1 HlyD family secretion protein [Pseudobutyrivibrio sp. NOR37]